MLSGRGPMSVMAMFQQSSAPEPEFLHASAQPRRAHYRPMSDLSASLMQFLRGSVHDQLSPESCPIFTGKAQRQIQLSRSWPVDP